MRCPSWKYGGIERVEAHRQPANEPDRLPDGARRAWHCGAARSATVVIGRAPQRAPNIGRMASVVASGERVDRVDPRVSLSIAHLPRIELPTETAANGRHACARGGGFTLGLPNPGRSFLGLLPAAPISVGTITRSCDFVLPYHWGNSGKIAPIRRRTLSSGVAGSVGCPGDLPLPKFEAVGTSATGGLPFGRGTGLKCGLNRHRYQSCAAIENAHRGRIHVRGGMLQSHFVGRAWFSARVRPLGDLDRCAMAFVKSLPGSPGSGENRSATIPSCRPDRVLSRVRVRRRAAFLRCPTRTVG